MPLPVQPAPEGVGPLGGAARGAMGREGGVGQPGLCLYPGVEGDRHTEVVFIPPCTCFLLFPAYQKLVLSFFSEPGL